MENNNQQIDLFNDVERRAKNLALSGKIHPFDWHENITGLLSPAEIDKVRKSLHSLSVDEYVSRVLDPAESNKRPSAKDIVANIRGKIHGEFELGPLYTIEISLEYGDNSRRVGFIVQNRNISNGVWSPEHHIEACRIAQDYAERNVPIVTFMDTPGACLLYTSPSPRD